MLRRRMPQLHETPMDELQSPLLSNARTPSVRAVASTKTSLSWYLVHRVLTLWHDCCDWLYWNLQSLLEMVSKTKRDASSPVQRGVLLEGLRQLSEQKFDWNDAEQQRQLQLMWCVGFPDEQFPDGLKSNRWKDMGWQSDDPSRDFRGGGALALWLLSKFAELNQDEFLDLMWKRRGERSEWEYPFAAAGVNLAYVLKELVQLRDNKQTPAARGFCRLVINESIADNDKSLVTNQPGQKVLYAIFNEMCLDLDRIWLETGASYMEFPKVLSTVRDRTARALGRWWVCSIDDYKAVLVTMRLNSVWGI